MDFFFVLLGFVFVIGTITLGTFHVIGTWQKWPFFVSPPEDWWCFYSLSFIKRIFGQKGLIIFNYSFGILCILLGLLGLFNGVRELLSP